MQRRAPARLGWGQAEDEILERIAPGTPVLDMVGATQSWLDLTSAEDPYRPACALNDRHLTCLTRDSTTVPLYNGSDLR